MRISTEAQLLIFAERLARQFRGGEIIELIGDVGAGKTTFTRGLARGLAIDDTIQSPTFTISREYPARDGLQLVHYDFYRLNEAGIMRDELAETIDDARNITVVEWADVTGDVLPSKRLTITILPVADDENARDLTIAIPNELDYLNEETL